MGQPGIGIAFQGRVDFRGRFVLTPHVQQQGGAAQALVDAASGLRDLVEGVETCRGSVLPGGRGEDRRIVERPLHRIARFDHDARGRRGARLRLGDFAGVDHYLALLVGRQHPAFEQQQGRAIPRHANLELGALDRSVEVRRVDREQAGFAAERLNRALDQIDQGTLLFIATDIDETHGGVLIETHHCLVDQHHCRPA